MENTEKAQKKAQKRSAAVICGRLYALIMVRM